MKSLFTELEFNALANASTEMNFSPAAATAPSKSPNNQNSFKRSSKLSRLQNNYTLINTSAALEKFATQLEQQDLWCFDLEPPRSIHAPPKSLGIAISWKAREAYFVTPTSELPLTEVLEALRPASFPKPPRSATTSSSTSVMLAKDLEVAPPFFDTHARPLACRPRARHNMDYLAESLLGYSPIKLSEVAEKFEPKEEAATTSFPSQKKRKTKKKDYNDMSSIPAEALTEYACEDATSPSNLQKF
ncbi:hypothetical protein [Rubritalea tangerina]|uniref:hypothetical protein n=1 Tax=Rubritalea tangerina TaxID=430798 RepID=UPI00360A9E56